MTASHGRLQRHYDPLAKLIETVEDVFEAAGVKPAKPELDGVCAGSSSSA